jgi:hypothetical protein
MKPNKTVKALAGIMVALLSGKRGHAARLVHTATDKNGAITITAAQDNKGPTLKAGTPCIIEKDGTLTGPKQGRVELGAYVNGSLKGAKVRLMTPAQFAAESKPGTVKWNADKDGVPGRFIGDIAKKGMVAVSVTLGTGTYYWQMESDSNSNNKHERGLVTKK